MQNQLDAILQRPRPPEAGGIASPETGDEANNAEVADDTELPINDAAATSGSLDGAEPTDAIVDVRPQLVAGRVDIDDSAPVYRQATFPDLTSQQGRFFDADYSKELRKMALAVVEAEGPVRDDVLARRVARAHGFGRTSSRIKERVLTLIPEVTFTQESVGRFLWPGDRPSPRVTFRYQATESERRSVDEIAMEELVDLVHSCRDLTTSDDLIATMARKLGLARLAQSARERLETAVEQADRCD